MKRSLILGKSNVGKTLFMINFGNYIGLKNFKVLLELPGGGRLAKEYNFPQAIKELVSQEIHTTLSLQSLLLEVPTGKGHKPIEVVDTTGLCEGLHSSREVRAGMAQTLFEIQRAKIMLHMIDVSKVHKRGDVEAPGLIDEEVYKYTQAKKIAYAMLANKMDLPGAKEGLVALKAKFPHALILPISAINSWGFKEVKGFLLRNI